MTKLCPRGKAAAKRKFRVYPSAYANAYASKICAGKIKDPSGVKRKDFRGPKPSKAMGGRIFKDIGGPVRRKSSNKTKPSKRPNIIQMTQEQRERRFNTPFKPKGKPVMAPKPPEIPRAKIKKDRKGKVAPPTPSRGARQGVTRPKMMGGGLMEATQRLRRQGYGKGGGVCIRGMNRDAVGKNS